MVAASTRHLSEVIALEHWGLVADLAIDLGVDVFVRGMGKEMAAEFEMATANRQISGVPTLFLPAEATTRWIASRRVRADYLDGGEAAVAQMVPIAVVEALVARSVAQL